MGQGLPLPAPGMVAWGNLFALPTFAGEDQGAGLARDWYLSGLAPPEPTEISWRWLSGELRWRQDRAVTYAAVDRVGGGAAVSLVDADEQVDFTATLDTANQVDAANLAEFMTTYYDQARTRLSQLTLILNARTVDEIWTILGVGIGDRIRITDVPDGWPEGADSLVVEGVAHSCATLRAVTWSTSPVIGETPGEVGPFFRLDASVLGGTDKLPW